MVMTNEEVIREFSALPAEARREVEDFIRFLRQRYGSESEATADGGDLRAESFVGMWKDREDFAVFFFVTTADNQFHLSNDADCQSGNLKMFLQTIQGFLLVATNVN